MKELELNFNRLSENNIKLRKEKGELGAQLGARTAEKAAVEKELEKVKTEANTTVTQLRQKIVSTYYWVYITDVNIDSLWITEWSVLEK